METIERRSRLNWRLIAWTMAGLLLLLPLIAMQFTSQVNWEAGDILIFGAMMGTAGLVLELAYRKASTSAYRAAVGLAVLAMFLLFWINGAVGIIGSEDNPANQMFTGIIAIAVVGAFLARFKPAGMALAMTVAAAAQVLVFGVALALGWGFIGPITLVFVALWLGSAQLFRKAANASGAESA